MKFSRRIIVSRILRNFFKVFFKNVSGWFYAEQLLVHKKVWVMVINRYNVFLHNNLIQRLYRVGFFSSEVQQNYVCVCICMCVTVRVCIIVMTMLFSIDHELVWVLCKYNELVSVPWAIRKSRCILNFLIAQGAETKIPVFTFVPSWWSKMITKKAPKAILMIIDEISMTHHRDFVDNH